MKVLFAPLVVFCPAPLPIKVFLIVKFLVPALVPINVLVFDESFLISFVTVPELFLN